MSVCIYICIYIGTFIHYLFRSKIPASTHGAISDVSHASGLLQELAEHVEGDLRLRARHGGVLHLPGLCGERRRRHVVHHLREGQRLGRGAAVAADALLDQRHGEALVGDAVAGIAHVLGLPAGDVEVDAQENVLEALGGVVHEAQLEALLVVEGLGEGAAERVGRQRGLMAVLEL